MDLTKPSELKRLLAAHNLHLSKRFGQNFLVDRAHLMRVVDTANIGPSDDVLEIGPGVGTLTVELAQRARSVIAVELDRTVLPALRDVTALFPNVEVIEGDALKLDLPQVLGVKWDGRVGKVAANIPYNITSPLVVQFLEAKGLFTSITLMVQKEVADRLRARPATEDYGSLSVFAQYYSEVSVAGIVPRGAFFPPPKVDSAIVHLVPRLIPPVSAPSDATFLAISRAAFGQRRKTLSNALTNAPTLHFDKAQVDAALARADVDGQRRGETLTLEEIAAISRALFDKSVSPAIQ